jgi:hypothetical protein
VFVLNRLESHLDQTLVVLQLMFTQLIPANLLTPSVFRVILFNVTLGFFKNFEMAWLIQNVNMPWYNDVITTSVIASPGGFWLLVSGPLKYVSVQYEVVKAYTFPTVDFNNKYVEVYLGKPCVATNLCMNTRLHWLESDLLKGI